MPGLENIAAGCPDFAFVMDAETELYQNMK